MSDLESLCRNLNLDQTQCSSVIEYFKRTCGKVGKAPRKRSQWQECIASRRAGKPFDPQAIRELAKEYKQGKCPP